MSQDALPLDDISLHFLGDEAILFDRRRQRFYGANASAAFIWSCLEDRITPERIVDILVTEHGLERALASQSVTQAIGQWRADFDADSGLAYGQASPLTDTIPTDKAPLFADPVIEPASSARLISIFRARSYRLLDSVITLRFETSALQRAVDDVFGHLAIDGTSASQIVLDLVVNDGGFAVLEQGRILEWCDSLAGVAVMAKICVIRCALEASGDFCALHAGLVRRGERCILLPGESGSGKSTLVAGLGASGYEVWGDDTAILAADTLWARPVSCGIGLKPGSWPVLTNAGFPQLARAPIHTRPDGKRVRYLRPPDYKTADMDDCAPVGWIVFPRFEADAATELTELSKTDALRRLLPGFVRLGNDLDAPDVARLVGWIDAIACFDLRLSSLPEAIALLDRVTT